MDLRGPIPSGPSIARAAPRPPREAGSTKKSDGVSDGPCPLDKRGDRARRLPSACRPEQHGVRYFLQACPPAQGDSVAKLSIHCSGVVFCCFAISTARRFQSSVRIGYTGPPSSEGFTPYSLSLRQRVLRPMPSSSAALAWLP